MMMMMIAQLAHAGGESIFCSEVWQRSFSQKTLGMSCCQSWISHGHKDNISEMAIAKATLTEYNLLVLPQFMHAATILPYV